jgi:cyclopropane fatty-acyl-phospholipid synthase-like methyltransferase
MEIMATMQRLLWDLMYLLGATPWDTGVTPPELRAVVENRRSRLGDRQVRSGRALDLGCGTGTNVIYLAQRGFEAIGVDISARAIARARRKIQQAGLEQQAHVYAGDVTRLDALPVAGLFDLALDMGCLHGVDLAARPRYVAGLASHMRPGGLYLLYAFGPSTRLGRRMGLSPEEARQLFAPAFELLRVDHGRDRGGVGSAWYTFKTYEVSGEPNARTTSEV